MLGPVEFVEEIDSTNAELLRRAQAGAPAGLVLVADHQTAGRGRLDRTWEAPPGASLLVSVLLRPVIAAEDLHLVTFAAGLAAVDACTEVAGVETSLKWPNDVVVDDDKVAGLLAESVVAAGRVEALVVGMGLNVNWPHEPPAGGAALNRLAGRVVDANALLTRWLEGFASRCDDSSAVLDEYRRRCSTLGRRVRVESTEGSIEGLAADIDLRGHLVVDGQPFAAGDVIHLRNASHT